MTTMTINPGTYTARATRWAWDTTQTEAVCLALMFRFTDEPHAEIDGRLYFDTDRPDDNGRTAADRSIEVLRAMGLKGGLETITDEGGGGLDTGDVSLVIEEKNGYPRVKYVNAPRRNRDLRTFAPPPADAKRAFFAQMNARLKVADAGARAAGARPTQPAPQRPAGPPRGFAQPAADDSEIPF